MNCLFGATARNFCQPFFAQFGSSAQSHRRNLPTNKRHFLTAAQTQYDRWRVFAPNAFFTPATLNVFGQRLNCLTRKVQVWQAHLPRSELLFSSPGLQMTKCGYVALNRSRSSPARPHYGKLRFTCRHASRFAFVAKRTRRHSLP